MMVAGDMMYKMNLMNNNGILKYVFWPRLSLFLRLWLFALTFDVEKGFKYFNCYLLIRRT